MKKFAFISDFDGTLSFKDFYHMMIDKYLKEWGREFYLNWKKEKKINVDFLNKIFGSVQLSQRELFEEIYSIPFDKSAQTMIAKVQKSGGDFFIVSAGTSYYIEVLLEHLEIKGVEVTSMKGVYEGGVIKIKPDPDSPYYSGIFGIDKRKVLEAYRSQYETIFYAGDSEPDLGAAKAADLAFARGELAELLKKENKAYIAFNTFSDIEAYLTGEGWFE